MMEVTTVAVINYRIVRIVDTFPFVLPCTTETTVFAIFKPRVRQVTQGNNTAVGEEVLADKRGVILFQIRDDTKRQVNQ